MELEIEDVLNYESEKIFKIILENTSDLIAIVNNKGKLEYINELVHKKLTGYTKNDLIGKSITETIYPKDIKKAKKELKKLYDSGYMEGEIRLLHKDGNYFWIQIKAYKFNDNYGKIKYIFICKRIYKPSEIESTQFKKGDKFREMIDNLIEIRFWKFLQPKDAFAAYQESQEMLKVIIDNIPQYIAWKDKNLLYFGCNNNFLNLTGIKDEKNIIGKTDFDLNWGEEHSISLHAKDTQVLESNEPSYHIIESWRNYRGEKIWFDTNRIPLHDLDGNTMGIIITFEDITKRKISEEILKESEEKFRKITEQSLIGICIIQDNLIKYANPGMVEIFGYTAEEMKKWQPEEFIKVVHPEYKELVMEQVIKKQKGSSDVITSYQWQGFKKTNESIWIEVNSKTITYEGRPADLVTLFDITEKKEAEEKLKESEEKLQHDIDERNLAEQKLKSSEAKYRHLFNSTPYGIWLVNLKGVIIDCNITMNKFMSIFTKEDLVGKSYREILKLFIMKGDPKWKEMEQTFKERFKLLLKQGYLDPIEFEIARGDGREFWITLGTSFVNLGKENLIQLFIEDITERKKVELKIKQSEVELKILNKELENKVRERTKELAASEEILRKNNLELRNLDKVKNDFITMAAHELKTPLISISGYTDYILTKHKDLSAEIKDDLLIVQRNIERLHNLMNQLLDVMKIESKIMDLDKNLTNVSLIIHNCLDELSYLLKEKNHKIFLNFDEELYLNIDSERIFQVFSNLLSNAIKFTNHNGIIEISAKKNNNNYIFEIKDNGIGLDPSELERLFRKFEMVKQIDSDNYIKGTGLGLYISKGFIQAHGGNIHATSEGHNTGTTFQFTIPI